MEAIMSAPGDRLTNTQIDKPTVRRGTRNSSVHDILCAVDVDAVPPPTPFPQDVAKVCLL